MPEPSDPELTRGFKKFLATVGRRQPRDEASDLAEQLRQALHDTPYPFILSSLQRHALGADATALRTVAEEAFAAARNAKSASRYRACILHLYVALAGNLIAGELEDASTAMGNLAMAFSALSDYSRALPIQRAALRLKQDYQNSPENVYRSFVLIAEIHFYTGDYAQCIAQLEQANELIPLHRQWSDLKENASRALEFQRIWRDSKNAKPLQGLVAYQRSADQAAASGDFAAEIRAYGESAARARLDGDRVAEARALLQVAELSFDSLRMYADAAEHAADAANLARQCESRDVHSQASYIQGKALLETGGFTHAAAAFEAGLAAMQGRQEPTLLELKLMVGSALALSWTDEREPAVRLLDRAISRAQQMLNDARLPGCFAAWGSTFRSHDHIDLAIHLLTSSIELLERNRIAGGDVAAIYSELAHCYFVTDQFHEALETLDLAIGHGKQLGDNARIGRSYVNMAAVYLRLDDVDTAQFALDDAEPYVNRSADDSLSAYYGEVLGEVAHRMLWRIRKPRTDRPFGDNIGTTVHNSSIYQIQTGISEIERRETAEDAKTLTARYTELAVELDRAGRFSESSEAFRAALRVAQRGKLRHLRGTVLHNYGVMQARRGHIDAARRLFQVALAYKDRFGGGAERLNSLVCLAQSELVLNYDRDYAALARQIESELANGPADEQNWIMVAGLYQRAGQLAEARDAIMRAVEHLRVTGTKDVLSIALTTAAGIELASGALVRAEQLAKEALHNVATHRAVIEGRSQPEWEKYGAPPTVVLLETLFRSRDARAAEALQILENAKVRSIVRRYGRRLDQPVGFPAELREQENAILSDLRIRDYTAELPPSGGNQLMLFDDEDDVYARAEAFWTSLPEEWQVYGRLRRGKPVDPLQVIQLDPSLDSTHFVVLYPTPEKLLAWHVTPNRSVISWNSAPITAEMVARMADEVNDAVIRRDQMPLAWNEFSLALRRSCIDAVPEGSTICFVPSGATIELPFALLQTGEGYLVERNPIACLPALSLLGYWTEHEPKQGVRYPLVLGDSRGDLPGARAEAKKIARRFKVQPVLGADVLRSNIQGSLKGCDLLHVSCHAQFDQASPEQSGFVLADGSRFSARDGLKLRLNARLAVLSACESGRLDVHAGDEMIGVAGSLLAAGIRSIVATSWRIPDGATTILMDEFYTALFDREESIASALRAAQRRVSAVHSYSHPFYWAAFRVLGDWRNDFL